MRPMHSPSQTPCPVISNIYSCNSAEMADSRWRPPAIGSYYQLSCEQPGAGATAPPSRSGLSERGWGRLKTLRARFSVKSFLWLAKTVKVEKSCNCGSRYTSGLLTRSGISSLARQESWIAEVEYECCLIQQDTQPVEAYLKTAPRY